MTRILIQCPKHGCLFLSPRQYRSQAGTEEPWRCPVCREACPADEIEMAHFDLGCQECKLAFVGAGTFEFDRQLHAFFCDRLCRAVYRQRLGKRVKLGSVEE